MPINNLWIPMKMICELSHKWSERQLQGARRPPDNFPRWIKAVRWNSIIYRCSCGFFSFKDPDSECNETPLCFPQLILPRCLMRRSVSLSTVTMYSGNILHTYLNTQTPRPVWQCGDLFSFRNSPTERCCYFSSHLVKPACAVYCVSLLFFTDRVTKVSFQNVSGNMNMLTNRYHVCSLMHSQWLTSTWAFVLDDYR